MGTVIGSFCKFRHNLSSRDKRSQYRFEGQLKFSRGDPRIRFTKIQCAHRSRIRFKTTHIRVIRSKRPKSRICSIRVSINPRNLLKKTQSRSVQDDLDPRNQFKMIQIRVSRFTMTQIRGDPLRVSVQSA